MHIQTNNLTGPELRNWREMMKLSQEGAALALGVTVRTYKRWEHSGVGTLEALACAALFHKLEPWPHSLSPRSHA